MAYRYVVTCTWSMAFQHAASAKHEVECLPQRSSSDLYPVFLVNEVKYNIPAVQIFGQPRSRVGHLHFRHERLPWELSQATLRNVLYSRKF